MVTVNIRTNDTWVQGHLRYGHFEGDIEIPDEDLEEFMADPAEYLKNSGLMDELGLLVDEYEIDSHGGEEITSQELYYNIKEMGAFD